MTRPTGAALQRDWKRYAVFTRLPDYYRRTAQPDERTAGSWNALAGKH